MAKRKRLTTPRPEDLGDPVAPAPSPQGMAPPISHMVGDAAAAGALRQVAEELSTARREGRMLLRLPLDIIDENWLMRDRMGQDDEALDSLIASLRAHGQRSPIEVSEISPGRYGLVSGWRRLSALRQLRAEHAGTPQEAGFATVLALPRTRETAEDAYVAMIEENEIRLGLSYYERARIAARAVEVGVFDTEKKALQKLYASASRAKRSKIGSFLRIYHALHDNLSFAPTLPERLGLSLVQGLDRDPGLAARLAKRLRDTPPETAEQEQALLTAALKQRAPRPARETPRLTITVEAETPATDGAEGRVVLRGPGLTPARLAELHRWLARC